MPIVNGKSSEMRVSKESLVQDKKEGIEYFLEATKLAKPYPTSSGRHLPFTSRPFEGIKQNLP
jgi:hypothetical protein